MKGKTTELFSLILLFLLIGTSFLYSQDLIKRRLYIEPPVFSNAAGRAVGERGQSVIYEHIKITIASKEHLYLLEKPEEHDAVLKITFQERSSGGFLAILKGFDAGSEDPLFTEEIPLDSLNIDYLSKEFFEDVYRIVREPFRPVAPEVIEIIQERVVKEVELVEIGKGVTLSISGVPGTRITGEGLEEVVLKADGRFEGEVPQNIIVNLKAEHPDYYTETFEITIAEEDVSYEIKQIQYAKMGIDALLISWMLCPGAGYVYNLVPDIFFLSGQITQNFIGFGHWFWPYSGHDGGGDDNSDVAYYVRPFWEFMAGAGVYFLPREWKFRMFVTGHLYTRLVMETWRVYFAKAQTIGLQVGLFAEFAPWKRLRFYAGMPIRLFWSRDMASMNVLADSVPGSFTLLPNLHATLVGPVWIGVRILF